MEIGYKDLRQWLSGAEKMGQVRLETSVDLEEDVGRIAEVSASTESGPAIILDEFKGYQKGYRILLNPFGTTKLIGWSYGWPTLDGARLELLDYLKKGLKELTLIPPKYVDKGPILENVMMDDQVDLSRFPVPKWHPEDGGPYIGTGCVVITKDPDEDWVNVGTYRNQLHDKNSVGFYVSPGHHARIHRDKYFSCGQACPVAVVLGSDPLLFTAGMSELPWGVCEYDWVGGWRKEPMEVIKGRVTGLPIPAHAEIVIEGFSYPDKRKHEGPFGEWTGYYASGARDEYYIDVKAVYHRNDPILLGIPPQKPPFDADKGRQFIKSSLLVQQLQSYGMPGISSAWTYGLGGCRLLVVVAIKQQYLGHARQVGHAAYSGPLASYLGRYVIVVDDDIDPSDLNDVMWAVLTRSDPATSIDIITRANSGPLDPRISPEDRAIGRFGNSRGIIDATMPFEWKDKFPKPVRPDIDWRKESRRRFGYLFEL